jgi:hypothetical protein
MIKIMKQCALQPYDFQYMAYGTMHKFFKK